MNLLGCIKNIFYYIMNTLDEISITNTDGSMNAYKGHIDSVESAMNKDGEYSELIEPNIDYISTSKSEISSFLQGLSFSTANTTDDISNMDDAYSHFYRDLQKSNENNSKLKSVVSKYQTTETQLKNAQKTNTYYMLLVWMIILMFVCSALFLSVIEDKTDMNIFSKSLLVIFSLVISFYIIKNSWFYIERNIQ